MSIAPGVNKQVSTADTCTPVFPNFKPLEMSDKPVIEAFTNQFEPYSDFCFSTLTFYNIDNHTHWCWLNSNLVLRFCDGFGPGTFLTFLGVNRPASTAETLIKYATQMNYTTTLWRVPEVTAHAIELETSCLRDDHDRRGFDYVYEAQAVAQMKGHNFQDLRSKLRRFRNRYPSLRFIAINLQDTAAQRQMRGIMSTWQLHHRSSCTLQPYSRAFDICIEKANYFNLFGLGVMDGESLVGFALNENRKPWFINHFIVTNPTISNLGASLFNGVAEQALTFGCEWLNFTEDLGDVGLRSFKMQFCPSTFLRKYSVKHVVVPTQQYSWQSPKLTISDTVQYGKGVYALKDIAQGEVLFVMGGSIMTREQETPLPPVLSAYPIELSESFSFAPHTLEDLDRMPQHYVNHSCNPNAGFRGQVFLVALRPILAGEQVAYDYAMCLRPGEDSPFNMNCLCGSPNCRRVVTNEDWKMQDLQQRYRGYFQWYLQEKINAIRGNGATEQQG
jgi:hypothetical protein